jgi:cobalt-zinc-cadmium efflux system protein
MAHDHSHNHGHDHAHNHGAVGDIKLAFFLNAAFTIFELIGGFYTNSLAIVSDAVHDLGDSFSLGAAWYLEKYSQRSQDTRYSYGYQRFSLLGALITTTVLIVGSIYVVSQAIPRLIHPEHSNAQGMIIFAIVGVVVNGLAALRLRGQKSMNARVVMWHFLEDVLGWVAVLIVGVALMFTDIHILDPLLSIVIVLYVLYNVLKNLKRTFAVLLQAVPEDIDLEKIEQRILGIEKVRSMHHTHVWSLDGEHHVLSTHVVIDPNATKDETLDIKCRIRAMTENKDIEHITIEIEFEGEDCSVRER